MKKIIFTLSLFATAAHAQQAIWANDNTIAGYQIASVANAEGSSVGYICNTSNKACDAYLYSNTRCEEDALYPLMVNSPLGAYPMSGKCMTLGKIQVLVIEQASAVAAFQSGGEIGFALPMANSAFKVFRFSTVGATAAIDAARTPQAAQPPQKKIRRDY